jgi:hypothetical protein
MDALEPAERLPGRGRVHAGVVVGGGLVELVRQGSRDRYVRLHELGGGEAEEAVEELAADGLLRHHLRG